MTGQRWTTPDGRWLTLTEDEPGIVKITTEALGELLQRAGMTRMPEDADVTVTTRQVLRDDHGRCQECGSPPEAQHRLDCPHYRGQVSPRTESVGSPYEVRPQPTGDVEVR